MDARLSRTTTDLDAAFYAASCFARSAADGSRTVTIMAARNGDEELYSVEDGRQGPRRDNVAGLDWWPAYYVERPEDEDDVRKREYLERNRPSAREGT